MSLTHPPRAWYGSSCGTSDRLAAALAASGWAVLPSPLPGRKRGCTSTAAPPPPGSNSPPLCRGALARSGKVWDWSVVPLLSAHLYLQSRVSSPVTSITEGRANAAKKATQAEEEFVRCVVRGETWAGRANPCGAWLWPALDLLRLIKVPQPEWNAAGQWLPAHAGDGTQLQRLAGGNTSPGRSRWAFLKPAGGKSLARKTASNVHLVHRFAARGLRPRSNMGTQVAVTRAEGRRGTSCAEGLPAHGAFAQRKLRCTSRNLS